jgi:hypothetical protein
MLAVLSPKHVKACVAGVIAIGVGSTKLTVAVSIQPLLSLH